MGTELLSWVAQFLYLAEYSYVDECFREQGPGPMWMGMFNYTVDFDLASMCAQPPRLPPELERKIFQLAAPMHHRKAITMLFLVARRVFTCKTPQAGAFAVQRPQTPRREARAGNGLGTPSKICFFFGVDLERDLILPVVVNTHIKRLTMDIEVLFWDDNQNKSAVDLKRPASSSITHLAHLEPCLGVNAPRWLTTLSDLPALTHAAFNTPADSWLLQEILAASPRIQVLIIAFDAADIRNARSYAEKIDFTHANLLVAIYNVYEDDWCSGQWGDEDIWVRAEEFLDRRRGGEISGDPVVIFNRFSSPISQHSGLLFLREQ
ncbi:hypothetical protein B0H13DRAFT_1874182 [Mycena leptocephala]|nr:hypothetical protein B0H13DRAFT_1874182 [Mycena leptocephala]